MTNLKSFFPKTIYCSFFLSLFLSGCSTDKSRYELLNENLNSYQKALKWGSVDQALLNVDTDKQTELSNELQKRIKNEKLVNVEIEKVDLKPDSDKATVTVITRYFKSPTYTVMERKEDIFFDYKGYNDGWKIVGYKEIKSGLPTSLPDPSGKMR